MKAPDKIYLQIDDTYGTMYVNYDKYDVENIEYIRKDALLEWAKAEIELSKEVECVSEKSYEEGRQQVAQNLIDKIELL